MTCTILQFLCRRVTEHRWRKYSLKEPGTVSEMERVDQKGPEPGGEVEG